MEIQHGDAFWVLCVLRYRRVKRHPSKDIFLEFPAERMRSRWHVEIRLFNIRYRVRQGLTKAIADALKQFQAS